MEIEFDMPDWMLIWEAVDHYQDRVVDKRGDKYADLARLKVKIEEKYKETMK